VLLDGVNLTARRPEQIRQAGVAIVPEGRRLLPDLTVEDNLRVASYALPPKAARDGRKRVLDLFPQLGNRLTALSRTLSGGEQQMVVLAQALITKPRYMLIDELSLGLAPVVVSRLIPVIRAVADAGTGVLLIEQFATVALNLASSAHIMEGGRIRFSGAAAQLRENPDLLRSAYLLRGSTAEPGPRLPGEAGEHGLVTLFLAGGGGVVGVADVEDVHRVQPVGAVAEFVPGELAPDVREDVTARRPLRSARGCG
jgi:branched-chain amino acid transport system ATP-binding protein